MKFKTKVYMVIFFSIIISGFSIFWLSYNIFSKEILTLEEEKIELLGNEAEDNIEEKINHIVSIMDFLIKIHSEKDDETSSEEREKKMLFYMENVYKYEPQIKAMGYGKSNKTMVFDRNINHVIKSDPTKRPWYVGAVNSENFYLSEIFLSSKTKLPIITVSKKIIEDKKVVGVLVVSLEISTFSKALRQYRRESKEAFFLLDKNNKFLFSTDKKREKYIGNIIMDNKFKSGEKYFVIRGDSGNVHYYIHKIDDLGLLLIGSVEEKELYSSIFKIRNYTLGVVILVLSIITGTLIIFYRKYNRMLNKLSNIIKAIATGDYSKNIDYILDGIDEKSELDKMKSAIHEMNYEIIKREEKLRIISEMDTLINIYNRRSILGFLDEERERKRVLGREYSLIMFDVDNFKEINDKFGHQFGDIVLLNIARKVSYNIKTTDKFGRIGGDEFLILLPSTGLSHGMEVAERIRVAVASMFWEDKDIIVTISVGVTTGLEDESVEEVLENVDKALYKAKNNGRNRVEG